MYDFVMIGFMCLGGILLAFSSLEQISVPLISNIRNGRRLAQEAGEEEPGNSKCWWLAVIVVALVVILPETNSEFTPENGWLEQ